MNRKVIIDLNEYNDLLEIKKNQTKVCLKRIEESRGLIVFEYENIEFVDQPDLVSSLILTNNLIAGELKQLKEKSLWDRIFNWH